MAAPDVIIVGGGVIGCATAYYLTQAGAAVTILERGEVGGEASGAAPAVLGAGVWPVVDLSTSMEAGPLLDLCVASMRLHRPLAEALRQETGIDVEYLRSGVLRVALTEEDANDLRGFVGQVAWEDAPDDLRAFVGPQGEWGLLQWVDPEVLRELEPRVSPQAYGAVYVPHLPHVNGHHLTLALAQAAVARGAVLRQGLAVTGFLTSDSRVIGVRTSEGRMMAGQVLLAAGAWTGVLGRRLGLTLPVKPIRGQVLAFPNFRPPVRHILADKDGCSLVPKANNFLWGAATLEDVGFRKNTTARGRAALHRMAASLVPSLAYAEGAADWAGLRPGSHDGLPILGPIPGWEGLSVASGHFRRGIVLAPITGRLMAQRLTEGRTEMPLEPFTPARFAASPH
jgi:glycine oxidase